jgi:hypothetical protein
MQKLHRCPDFVSLCQVHRNAIELRARIRGAGQEVLPFSCYRTRAPLASKS